MPREAVERGESRWQGRQNSVDETFGDLEELSSNLLTSSDTESIALFFELGDKKLSDLTPEGRQELSERIQNLKAFSEKNLAVYAERHKALGAKLLSSDPEGAYCCFAMSHALALEPMAVVSDVKETLAIYTGGDSKLFDGVREALLEGAEAGPIFFLSGDTKDALVKGFILNLGVFDTNLRPNPKIARSILENFHLSPHTGATILYLRAGDKNFRTEKLLGGLSAADVALFEALALEAASRFDLVSKYGSLETEPGKGPGYFHFDEIFPGNFIFDFYPIGVVKQHERSKFKPGGSHYHAIKEILQIFEWMNESATSRTLSSGKVSLGGLTTGDGRIGNKGDAIQIMKEKFLPSNARITTIGDRIEKDGNDADMLRGSDYAIHVGSRDTPKPEGEYTARRIVASVRGHDGGAAPFLLSAARANRWFQVLAPEPPSLSSEVL